MSTYSSFLSNIFMAAYIETESLSKTVFKLAWISSDYFESLLLPQ